MNPSPPATDTLARPSPGAIDPRIRARRIEVRRRAGRQKLQRLVDLGLVILVAAAFVGALWTPLLDVDEIRVEGADRTGPDVVVQHSGIERGDRLVSVDVGAVGARVAALPWVGEVEVRRRVDGTVVVRVSERAAVAVVGAGAAAVVVDRDGRVLAPAVAAAGLPVLEVDGPIPAPGEFLDAELDTALLVAERVHAVAPGAVAAVALDDGLVAVLAQGGQVRFGDTAQLEAKLRSLRTVLDQVDLRCLATIDLRLPGSPVLTREERCS